MKDYIKPTERLNFKITGKEEVRHDKKSESCSGSQRLREAYAKRRETSKIMDN